MSDERQSPVSLTRLSRRQRRAAARAANRAAARGALPAAGAALALSLGLQPSKAHANTFEVTNLNDDGAGSLRQAIASANANPDADVITFQSGLSGTITLTTGHLIVSESVEIQGPGSGVLAISGNNSSGVFYLYNAAAAAVDVTISGLKITGGHANHGGGVADWSEHLTLDSVEISGNTATGLSSGSTGGGIRISGIKAVVTIRNSVISGNSTDGRGGGVYAQGVESILIQDTEITDNQSSHTSRKGAGGVSLRLYGGDTTIERTTISGNSTNGAGGGVFLYLSAGAGSVDIDQSTIAGNSSVEGGGIHVRAHAGQVTVQNSTVSGNQATAGDGGGISVDFADIALDVGLSTISGNSATGAGGGVLVDGGNVALTNTIVADNTAASNADVGGTIDADYSLIETVGTATLMGSNNKTGMDPQLSALADNGGPTETQMPAFSSPAINGGDPAFASPPAADQRGRTRVVGSAVDMGALELNAGTLQCSMANVSVSEDADLVMLSVTRVGGSDGPANVDIATTDGTAKEPSDYTQSMATLQWSHNDMAPKTLSVPITDDNLVDPGETFTATLSNATGATLGATTSVTVTIDDDDEAPSISAIADQTINENDSTKALKFKISDPDDDTVDLVVSAKSSKHSLLADDDIVLGGSGANRTVTVKPLADKTGKVDVTLTVSDGTNSSTSTFRVTVKAFTEPVPDAGMMEPADAGADAGGSSGSGGTSGTGGSGSGGNPSTGGEDASAGGSGGEDASTAAPGSDAGEADAGGEKLSGGGGDCGCTTVGASTRPSGVLLTALFALLGVGVRRRRKSGCPRCS